MAVTRTLDTARLHLRPPQASDLPAYTAYCASDRSRFVRGPFSAAEAFDKFAAITGHWTLRGYGRYVMTRQGHPIGHVGPLHLDTAEPAEMTWTLWDAGSEGQGYATEAARSVWAHLCAAGWDEMIIRIQPDNHGSVAIARRIGAVQTDETAPDWYPGALTFRLNAPATASERTS